MRKVMNGSVCILVLILFCTSVVAQDAKDLWIYQAKELELDVQTDLSLAAIKSRPDAFLDRVEAKVSFYPKTYRNQRIVSRVSTIEPTEENGTLTFIWDKPSQDEFPLSIKTKVRISNDPIRVRNKVNFPLQNIPDDVWIYTEPAEIIDQNDAIVRLASELAAGEDDLAVIVDKIAAWTTQNIEYNLSTVNAEASLKSSWVLANREGVCDELTSLFISLLRSLRIPARFVVGISYTNSPLFDYQWGPHGWAEVYFPGHGWIPYDVTYGQYGFVDATHIKAYESSDAQAISTKFNWRGRHVTLKIRGFSTKVSIAEHSGTVEPVVDISIDLMKNYVGFGSHNLIEATITNLKDYYQSFDVSLANTEGLEMLGPSKQHVLLQPNREETLYWIVKTGKLKKGFQYTFPILIYSVGDIREQAEFGALSGGAQISLKRAKETMSVLDYEGQKEYTRDIKLVCKPSKPFFYVDEQGSVTCTLTNNGNVILQNARLCIEDDCKVESVGITQQSVLKHQINPSTTTQIIASADGEGVSERFLLDLNVLDLPELEFINVDAPASVNFDDSFVVRFSTERTSASTPKDMQVSFFLNGLPTQFHIKTLEGRHEFKVNVLGETLEEGTNTIRLEAKWHDERGREYSIADTIDVVLENLTLGQKIIALLNKFTNFLSNL